MTDNNENRERHKSSGLSELNTRQEKKRANFSVESHDYKPYDVNKMTGNSSNNSDESKE